MSTAPVPAEAVIDEAVHRALDNVLKTMAQTPVSFVSKSTEAPPRIVDGGNEVMGSVGFVGAANGIIYLRFPEPLALLITSRILGMSIPETEAAGPDAVKDALGEVTNMSVGGFKNALCDLGFFCTLTLPTVIRGNRLSIYTVKSASRHVYHYDCDGHKFIADLQVKLD